MYLLTALIAPRRSRSKYGQDLLVLTREDYYQLFYGLERPLKTVRRGYYFVDNKAPCWNDMAGGGKERGEGGGEQKTE